MEKFNGKWELVPELYENMDAFSEKMGVPQEQKDMIKNLVMISTLKLEGNKLHLVIEYKGQPIKQELCFTEGEPLDYKGFDGSEMTTEYTRKGDRLYEKHKAVTKGITREWTVERYIEGDMQVAISRKDDVSMTYKMKRV
ncbi:fatty acid-binding protein type 2-like [Haliotis asinina]|uniref:fatty acid-binding protein type 2-like n=1 Tax=Haliotis asinina TaxID=109174 RepID=UPI00353235E3